MRKSGLEFDKVQTSLGCGPTDDLDRVLGRTRSSIGASGRFVCVQFGIGSLFDLGSFGACLDNGSQLGFGRLSTVGRVKARIPDRKFAHLQ
jgi:hypothetical protein